MTLILTTLAILLPAPTGDERPRPHYRHPGCHTHKCDRRMDHKAHGKTLRRWKRTARPYAAWLRSTRTCESGSAGGYHLITTGNGFWFSYQHTPSSWYAAGGHSRNGVPAGVRGPLPEPAEQDFRAVITLHQQGPEAWPICGR